MSDPSSSVLAFEDFTPGTRFELPPYAVTREEIVAFAAEFDPQPFHLDEEAAKATLLGGLAASGWHTCSMMMRMMVDGYLARSTSQGSSHVDEIRWLAPVRPGDTLGGECVVEERRLSASRPGLGMARISVSLWNGSREPVLAGRYLQFLLARDPQARPLADASQGAAGRSAPAPSAAPAAADAVRSDDRGFFGHFAVGDQETLGSAGFTEGGILAFARAFDPQAFHLDREAAARSLLGGLCASGWHVAAAMMRVLVTSNGRHAAAWQAEDATRAAPVFGPSPGIRNLRWTRPVYAGDTITYRRRVVAKRLSASRPGWGIVDTAIEADNQDGVRVFSMEASAFVATG